MRLKTSDGKPSHMLSEGVALKQGGTEKKRNHFIVSRISCVTTETMEFFSEETSQAKIRCKANISPVAALGGVCNKTFVVLGRFSYKARLLGMVYHF